eukprot:m.236897 g.236897  ORF g.236897 m.236897 type:complete len:733 (-) comp20824_c0_seq1:75-2273(-)
MRQIFWTGFESFQGMFADAVKWERLVFEDVAAHTAVSSAGTDEDPVDVKKWSTNRENMVKDPQIFLFREVLLVCRRTDKDKFVLAASPVRVSSIVLSPQTVFDLKEEGHAPRSVRLMYGEYTYTIVAVSPERRNALKAAISEVLSRALVEDKVSPRRRQSSDVLLSTTTFTRPDIRSMVVEREEESSPEDAAMLALIAALLEETESPPTPAAPATPVKADGDLLQLPEGVELSGDQSSSLLRRKAALRKGSARDETPTRPSVSDKAGSTGAGASEGVRRVSQDEDSDPMLVSAAGEEQMVLQFVKGELLLMAGTRGKLIEYVTCPQARGILCQAPQKGKDSSLLKRKVGANTMLAKTSDAKFMAAFLLTYRLIIAPSALLAALQARFEFPDTDNEIEHIDLTSSQQQSAFQQNNRETRIKVLTVLEAWVRDYWHDFAIDPALLAALRSFLKVLVEYGYDQFSTYCEQLIAEQTKSWAARPAAVVPARVNSGPLASIMLHSDPAVLATQLTAYDAAIFNRIKPVEFLNHVIKPKKKAQGIVDGATFTSNLNEFIERFDKESYWVQAEVVAQQTPKEQAGMISKFAEVVRHCLAQRNLYSVFAIVGALGFPKIRKLKDAWDLVPRKVARYLQQLEETIMNPSKNMKNYREVLRKLEHEDPEAAILPFIPVVLKDLLFMNEGNDDQVESMINFDKLRMMAGYVLDLHERNIRGYYERPDPGFQAYLAVACVAPDE